MAAGGDAALPPGAGIEDFRRQEAVLQLLSSIRVCGGDDAVQVMAWVLDELGAGIPEADTLTGRIREDAAWWADLATPHEVEAYVAAGLRRIERTAFCEAARKRIFAAIWESFGDADRKAFLGRVDPAGRFTGRGR